MLPSVPPCLCEKKLENKVRVVRGLKERMMWTDDMLYRKKRPSSLTKCLGAAFGILWVAVIMYLATSGESDDETARDAFSIVLRVALATYVPLVVFMLLNYYHRFELLYTAPKRKARVREFETKFRFFLRTMVLTAGVLYTVVFLAWGAYIVLFRQ